MSSAKAYKTFVAREASRKRLESMNSVKRVETEEEGGGLLQRRPKQKETRTENTDGVQEAMRSYFEMVRKLAGDKSDA